jgi:hypothetical protein
MKHDLKSAFHLVRVSAYNRRQLLIFEWKSKYGVDICLSLGLWTAARIFNFFETIRLVLEAMHD